MQDKKKSRSKTLTDEFSSSKNITSSYSLFPSLMQTPIPQIMKIESKQYSHASNMVTVLRFLLQENQGCFH